MEQELIAFLEGLETRLSEKITRAESRLNEKIGEVESRLNTKIEAIESRLSEKMDEVEIRLRTEISERVEKVETSLLTEFHKWARTYEVRDRGTTTLVTSFAERFSLIEDRVSELERHLPPPSKRIA